MNKVTGFFVKSVRAEGGTEVHFRFPSLPGNPIAAFPRHHPAVREAGERFRPRVRSEVETPTSILVTIGPSRPLSAEFTLAEVEGAKKA